MNEDKAHADNWFWHSKTKFIVDGIDLSSIEKDVKEYITEEEKQKIRMNNIVNAENTFIDRVKNISENTK